MKAILTHRIDGDGEPLILLNGGLMTIPSWDRIALELSDHYRVIRCDFRGQLLSPGEPHNSLMGHVGDVLALLDDLGIRDLHVLGTSFGGAVALLLAAHHPQRVRSLTILTATDRLTDEMLASSHELVRLSREAAEGGDGGAVFRALAPNTFSDRWLATQPADFIELRTEQIAKLPPVFFEGLTGLMEALETLDLSDELPRITAPTMIIGAENDRVFPIEHSHALAAAIEGAELVVIEGSGHAAVVEAPDRVIAGLRDFHRSLAGAWHG